MPIPDTDPLVLPVLQESFDLWRQEAPRFLAFGALATVVGVLVGQLPLIGLPLALAIEGPLAAGLARAAWRLRAGERPGAEDFLLRPEQWAPFLALSLTVQCLFLLGALLLVVPGLLAMAWFSVAVPAQLRTPGPLVVTLRRSVALVQPRLFSVLGLTLLLAGFELLISLPIFRSLLDGTQPTLERLLPLLIGLCLLTPLQGIAAAVLHDRLARGERVDVEA